MSPHLRWPLAFTIALVAGASACAADVLPTTGEVLVERLESEIVNDTYVLRVRLPPDYDPDERYPVVVQLDPTFAGLQEFAVTAGLQSAHEQDGDWPAAIVLGVDYRDPATRERDYRLPDPLDPEFASDGADRFHAALREEILPYVEQRWAVDPSQRMLLGHSNGGVFAWYAAFRHDDGEPPLFAGIVAADNGYDLPLFTLERWHAERASDLPMRLYATHALFNGAAQKVGFDFMRRRVLGRHYPGLAFQSHELETDHAGAVEISFEEGLDHLYGATP